MLRSTNGILIKMIDYKLGNSSISLEFVRWRRKPRWLPVAKSKLFRVPERKPQPEDEKLELMRLHNHYKTQMRSVRMFLREDLQRVQETSTADHFVITQEQEEAEFQKSFEINEIWNKKIAEQRNQRLELEALERRIFIENRLELAMEREEEQKNKIEEIVKYEKEQSKSFVTLENLDSAIEYALANPVDYNFSVDLKGNIYRGRNTFPGTDENKTDVQEPLAAVEASS